MWNELIKLQWTGYSGSISSMNMVPKSACGIEYNDSNDDYNMKFGLYSP